MKTTTPQKLAASYAQLNPSENLPLNEDVFRIMRNWLNGYAENPDRHVAMSNYYGKVTRALFHALGFKMSRTKKEALSILSKVEYS